VEDHEFYGWKDGGTIYNAGEEYVVTRDVVFIAQWEEIAVATYAVTFIANGGSSPFAQTINAGDSITLPLTTRNDYTFSGWYTDSSGNIKVGNAGASYTPTGNITLYAQWTQNAVTQYTVTYNASSGTVTPGSATVNAGSSITLPTPSRGGYTCNGWYTAASGGTKIGNTAASYTPTGNITLYAQWQEITVTTPSITAITLTSNETGFRITWDSVATSYKVFRSNAQYGSYSNIATGITDTSYDDTSVSMTSVGNSYFYRIVATNTAGIDSSQSTPKGITIKAPTVRGFYIRTSDSTKRQGCLGIGDMNYFTSVASSNGTSTLYTSWQTIAPGTHTIYTASTTSTSTSWNPTGVNRGNHVFKAFHAYRISINTGNVTDDGVELVID
jgi:uncharacterized repeat protein (TIGR02543 family)